jgi:hypothetical protein
MRRDLALYRAILLQVESWPPNRRRSEVELEGWERDTINRHVQLLEEEGFVLASFLEVREAGYLQKAYVERMTAAGHDFLDSIRDEGIWTKVQGKLKSVGGSASADLVAQLAMIYVRRGLGLELE